MVGTPDIQKKDDGTFYGNANFYIADVKNGTTMLYCFRLKGLENSNIESETYIKDGDQLVVTGQLQKYVKEEVVTPEVKNGYIYSIDGSASVDELKANTLQNAPAYNVGGQRVNDGYKGLVIKGGKKMVQK